MILLELDPNIVKPGWTPLLITVGLAVVMVLLFRSMRRHFRRVDAYYPEPTPSERPEGAAGGPTGQPGASATPSEVAGTEPNGERAPRS